MSPPDEILHMDLPTLEACLTDLEAKFAQQAAAVRTTRPVAPPAASTTPAPSRPCGGAPGTVAHRHALQGRAGQPGAAPGVAPVLSADCQGLSGGGHTRGQSQRGPWNLRTWRTPYGGMKQ